MRETPSPAATSDGSAAWWCTEPDRTTTDSAATTWPSPFTTRVAMESAPGVSSLRTVAYPVRRHSASSLLRTVGWEFRRWRDGTILSSEDLATACERLYGEHTCAVYRADLLDVLKRAVPEEAVRLGKRCVALDLRDGRPLLRFDDGEVAEADVVIGADGVHSVVRGVIAEPRSPTYSGLCAFRAWSPSRRRTRARR